MKRKKNRQVGNYSSLIKPYPALTLTLTLNEFPLSLNFVLFGKPANHFYRSVRFKAGLALTLTQCSVACYFCVSVYFKTSAGRKLPTDPEKAPGDYGKFIRIYKMILLDIFTGYIPQHSP